jgi:hypothetical protein
MTASPVNRRSSIVADFSRRRSRSSGALPAVGSVLGFEHALE